MLVLFNKALKWLLTWNTTTLSNMFLRRFTTQLRQYEQQSLDFLHQRRTMAWYFFQKVWLSIRLNWMVCLCSASWLAGASTLTDYLPWTTAAFFLAKVHSRIQFPDIWNQRQARSARNPTNRRGGLMTIWHSLLMVKSRIGKSMQQQQQQASSLAQRISTFILDESSGSYRVVSETFQPR